MAGQEKRKYDEYLDAPDMCVPCGNGFINIRVGAIIMKESRILMVRNNTSDYFYSVGGRIKFGETAEDAVVREVFEETGVEMEIDHLGFILENYFIGDSPAKLGKEIYEMGFYFYMKVPEDFTPVCESITEDGETEYLEWVSPDEPMMIYPEFFRTELDINDMSVKYRVQDDRPERGFPEPVKDHTVIRERPLDDVLLDILIRLSADWEAENSCYGYRKNEKSDIEGNRIFLAENGEEIIGYLFGHKESSEKTTSVMPDGTPVFEVEEIYVKPGYRSKGIGRKLFLYAEEKAGKDVDYIMLSTATKNWKAILHFYLEELGMEFWSARLFKKVKQDDSII